MRLISCGLTIALGLLGQADLFAQGFGPPDPGTIFNYMDRNQDGQLDRDEIDNSRGPMRDRLQQMNVDYSRGLSRDDFVRTMERAREAEGGDRGGDDRRSEDRGREEDRNRDDDRSRSDDRSRDDSRSGGDSRSRGSAAPPPKVRVTIDLQQTFKEGDRDFDGQIGFYEWRQWKGRTLAAEFARLDINGDGFLTPREIERSGAAPAGSSPTTAVATNAPRPPQPGSPPQAGSPNPPGPVPPPQPGNSSPTARPGAPAPAVATAPPTAPNPAIAAIVIDEDNPSVRRYRSQFKLLDRDSSGTISTDEWERSTNIRGRFTEAKVDITQPMDSDGFVRNLLHLDAPAAGG
jgi:Ca2+-binding EF-hand superfamily protein